MYASGVQQHFLVAIEAMTDYSFLKLYELLILAFLKNLRFI